MRRASLIVSMLIVLSGMPTAAADEPPGDTGTWFDGLDAGVCIDDVFDAEGAFDFSPPARIVDCTGPHDDEVVARVSLAEGDYTEDGVVAMVESACGPEYEAFVGRPVEASNLWPFIVAPSAEDWSAGVRHGLCLVYASEPVRGTARSGLLRAPGETLAAYRQIDDAADIWLIDAGSGELTRQVTDGSLSKVITVPSWTPDGDAVTVLVQTGATKDETDVYAVSLADGAATPLVEGPAREDSVVFSPDGSTIAFISAEGSEEFDIYSRDLESGVTTRLTTHADRDTSPQWSPDGSRIAFRRRIDGVSHIWTMAPDGSDQRQLTFGDGNDYDPRWSPDGSHIAMTTDRAGNLDVAVVAVDGGDPVILTNHPADDEYPTWSSDGSFLAFQSDRHGGVSLWLMRADGSDQSELTGLAPVGYAMFAPVPIE